MSKKVTIQDIADALGISRNTVSKAINNSDGLADATRERILQKAAEMGYKQFSYVAALANIGGKTASSPEVGFTGEIALFTTSFLGHSHFASLMLDKFQREITQLGYTLNTHRVTPDDLAGMTLPVTFSRERTSAILCIEMFDHSYDEMVCALGLPTLFVDGPAKVEGRSLPCDQLYMDNTTEVTRFVNEALRAGKKGIGFIGNWEHCQSFYERYTAFRLAMLLAGAPVEDAWCVKTNDREGIAAGLEKIGEMPDIFLCANDFLAIDAVQLLRDLGHSVPADVEICGFDDAAEAKLIVPTLTTIHIHTQVMAFSAVHLLMSRAKEPSLDFRTIHTETDLIYRDSTTFQTL